MTETACHKKGDILNTATCGLCAQSSVRVVATRERTGAALLTVMCTGCGLIRSEPVPTDTELQNYYRSQYRSDYKAAVTPKLKHTLRYAPFAAERLKRLKTFIAPDATIFDVGSGSGEFLYMCKLDGMKATGMEPHEGYARYTAETFGVSVQNTDIAHVAMAPESLDAITLNHVLEHLRCPFTALSTLHGWLKPNGILAVEVPDADLIHHAPAKQFHYAHIYNFSHETLKGFLEQAGFTVIDHPFSRGTSLFAKKTHAPDINRKKQLPENAAALWKKYGTASNLDYYKTITPYWKLFHKAQKYTLEYIRLRGVTSAAHVIEGAYARAFGRASGFAGTITKVSQSLAASSVFLDIAFDAPMLSLFT